jgi:hypothetical protein
VDRDTIFTIRDAGGKGNDNGGEEGVPKNASTSDSRLVWAIPSVVTRDVQLSQTKNCSGDNFDLFVLGKNFRHPEKPIGNAHRLIDLPI